MQLNRHLLADAVEVINGLGELNETFDGANVLLTGAAGFLGAHFVHYFLALNDSGRLRQKCRILAIDNFSRGLPHWLKQLESRPDLELQRANITQKRDFPLVEFVIHAASIASPTFYRLNPIETMDANVIGMRNLLDHAVTSPPRGFLFFSTSEIYGDPTPENIPTRETYRGNVSCTGPRACYDESKRYGETLAVTFALKFRLNIVTVRPFNNYGPGLPLSDRRVLPDFFRDAMKKQPIVLLSDGSATRTFCYVSDALEGYLRAMLKGRSGEAYNIGAEKPEISVRELADQVAKVTGSPELTVYGQSEDQQYLTDNPQRRCPSIAKARKDIGFEPRVSLNSGLQKMYQYYLDQPQ